MQFEEVRDRLAAAVTATGSGVAEARIREAELRIGAFPDDYRQYLGYFGWAILGHYEIFGLGQDVPGYLNVVQMTLAERLEPAVPLPGAYVCVMNDGGGNLLCFDSGRLVAGESSATPMLLWDHELGAEQAPEIVAASFADWLAYLLETLV